MVYKNSTLNLKHHLLIQMVKKCFKRAITKLDFAAIQELRFSFLNTVCLNIIFPQVTADGNLFRELNSPIKD